VKYFSGKCYNVPPEFLEKKRKPRLEQTPIFQVDARQRENDQRHPKLMDESEEEEEETENNFNNIPAILPYEAKVALLREISQTDRKSADEPEEVEKIDRGTGKSGKKQAPKNGAEDIDDSLDEHFFYGNHPVMDYKLSDGSKGNVDQVPR
jgi:hypothetical protein